MFPKEFFGVLTAAIAFLSYGIYFHGLLRKEIRPHVFSWVVWSLTTGTAFFAQLSKGAGPGAWAAGFSAALSALIAVCALFYGERNITRSDWLAFAAALAAILLWQVTGNPLWAVVLVTAADAFGFYPTFRKSYAQPREEAASMFFLSTLKWALSLVALEDYSLTSVFYPLVTVATNGGIVAMLLWRRAALGRARG